MKIIDHAEQSYSEIPQNSKIVFSLGIFNPDTESIQELCWPVKCRDFFNEVALKQWTHKDYQVYGFKTNEFPVFLPEQAVYLICKNIPADKVSFIWEKVTRFIGDSVVNLCKDCTLAIQLPHQYLKYSVALSYITFLIRCVEQYEDLHSSVVVGSTNESQYLRTIEKATGITGNDLFKYLHEIIMSGKIEYSCGLDMTGKDVHTIHNGSGIMSAFINKNNQFTKALLEAKKNG